MGLELFLIIGGAVLLLWLYLWSRERQTVGRMLDAEESLQSIPMASAEDAVLVSRGHGQLVYVNDSARRWLGMNGGDPNLEVIAEQADPVDSFLELFAAEGQSSFQLGKRWVEASSHRIPTGSEVRTVVVMRELSSNTQHADVLDMSSAMTIINEIGETINVSMGVEQVLQALLTIVRKAIPAEAGEICIYQESDRALYPRGWVGDSAYVLALAEVGGMYRVGEGITGWIAQYQKPVLVADLRDQTAIMPKLTHNNPYQSFLGVPLMLGERLLGTLELSGTMGGQFSRADLALLQAVSKQAAIAIYNAQLYQQQSQRVKDMAGLQQVTEGQRTPGDSFQVYYELNKRIASLTDSGMCGILIYDEEKNALVAELPFFGLPDHVVRNYIIPVPADSPQRDIWENQPYWISNDVEDEELVEVMGLGPLVDVTGVRSTALIPMQIGNRRIGIIQVSNKQAGGGFNSEDVQNLRILAAQAAIVVENVRLFQREHRRESELTGLQEITHAIGALSHEGELYSDISERIARQMGASMCGILLYDESRNRLVSQLPFYGVRDELVAHYQIDLPPGSALYDVWNEADFWYTNRVNSDPVVIEAELEDLAAVIGVTKTMMAPLQVGGRRLGVVQVSNKVSGDDFNDTDARLLMIFATQAAAIIENGRLYREMQRRADESESLRRVAELAGAILQSDTPFTPVFAEIVRLMDSPLVFMNVLDQQTGSLICYPRWVHGMELADPLVIDAYADGFENSVAVSKRSFVSNDLLHDERLLRNYSEIAQRMGLVRGVLVPLVVGDQSLGELGVANRIDGVYSDADKNLLQAIAAQIAATIDRVRLYENTGQNLSRRLQELDAISRVSNELANNLELDRILDVIRHEASRIMNVDGSSVVLLRPRAFWVNSEIPEMDRRIGDKRSVAGLAAVEADAVLKSDTVIVADYEASTYTPNPAKARSAIVVPFLHEGEVVGVIHLHHATPNTFDERAVTFLLALATKATLGYGNAIRLQETVDRSNRLRQRVEQLNEIFELGKMLRSNVDQVTMLEAIAHGVQSVGFNIIVMSLMDDEANVMRRVAQAGLPIDVFEGQKGYVIPRSDIEALLKPQYKISSSYFFPAEKIDDWAGNLPLQDAEDKYKSEESEAYVPNEWKYDDMLIVPLYSSTNEILGMMSLDKPQNRRRPDRNTIEILEIFAHQAASTIENTRLYIASVRNAEQEARLNEVLEEVTSTLRVEEMIEAVARGALRMLPFTRLTVALFDSDLQGFQVLRVDVTDEGALKVASENRASLEHTALGAGFGELHDVAYHRGDAAIDQYDDLYQWYKNGEESSLIVPLSVGGARLGVFHLGCDQHGTFKNTETRTLIRRMANLFAIALQNARLFNQAVNLQAFNQSVVESIQQGIVVLDRSARILSLNEFMINHYGWDKKAIGQDLFSYQKEYRTFLTQSVRSVLEAGEPQELIGRVTENNGHEQVSNYYVYPLQGTEQLRGVVILVEDTTDRALLEADIQVRANQLAALTEVSRRITATLRREEVIALALEEMDHIIDYDTATLWRRDGEYLYIEGARGYGEGGITPLGIQVQIESHERLRNVMNSQRALAIDRLLGWDLLPGEEGAQSWMGVPLLNQGNLIGMVTLSKKEPNFYGEQSQQAAFTLGNQVAVALSNADLFAESERRTARLSLLNQVSVALAQSLDMENILEVALLEIARTMQVQHARAISFERDLQIGRVVVEQPRGDNPPFETINLQTSATYKLIRKNVQPLIYENVEALPADDPVKQEIASLNLKSYIVLPLAVGGQVIGSFELAVDDRIRRFEPEQIELSQIIANQAAIAMQNAGLLEQTLVRTRELETLLEAAHATSLTMELDKVMHSVVELMLQALDMDSCAVMIWDDVADVLEVSVHLDRTGETERTKPEGTVLNLTEYPARARALRDREVIIIRDNDATADAKELAELRQNDAKARMLLPLVVRDRSIGLIEVELRAEYRTFGSNEIRLARGVGTQAAIAIENARLSTESASQIEELFIINDLSRAISATMDMDDMIRIVREQVPKVTNAEGLYLALFDKNTQTVEFPLAVQGNKEYSIAPRPLNMDEVSFIIRQRRPLILGGDSLNLDDVRRSLGVTNGEGSVRSYLGVPLLMGDEVMGALAIFDTQQSRAFGLNDQRILTTVGSQLGAAIQNANLFTRIRSFADELEHKVQERTTELEQERDRLDTLYQITAELSRTLDMDMVLNRALSMVAEAVRADAGAIMLVQPGIGIQIRASLNLMNVTEDREIPLGEHPVEMLSNWLMNHGEATLIDDLTLFEGWQANSGTENFHSALIVFLEANNDVQGIMMLFSSEVGVFTPAHLKLVRAASGQVAAAINNADLFHLIRDQAEQLGTLLREEQEEAQKSTAILESIADGVMLANESGEIILFNTAAERILEVERDRVMGQSVSRMAGLYGGSSGTWGRVMGDWAHERGRQSAGEFLEEKLELGNRFVSVHLSPVYMGNQFLGTVSVFRDITKEVEVDRVKSEFISNVSHELRTPMTSIKGYADLLLLGAAGETSEVQKRFLHTIKVNADRLSSLVNDLLNISKLDSGSEQLKLEMVDLDELLNTVVTNLQGRVEHERKKMNVSVYIQPKLPPIKADQHKLTQIVTNLVDNAFNYTYPGGNIDISAVLQEDDINHVLVAVRDTGIGIPEAYRERIWERFERNEEHALVMDVAGTGLGLPIVKKLVEMHNATIWFDSEVGKGTTFYVSLPIDQPEQELQA